MAAEAESAITATQVAWHVSTRSGSADGNCVEAGPVLDGSGRIAVRDSKDRNGPILVYGTTGWTAFLTTLKHSGYPQSF